MSKKYIKWKKHPIEEATGLTIKEIADKLGLKVDAVYRVIRTTGIENVIDKVANLKKEGEK